MGSNFIAYNLLINSELDLPEFIPAEDDLTPDITIQFGKTPEKLEKPLSSRYFFQASPDYFLMRVDGIANYYVTNGNRIVIEQYPNADELSVRLILIGSVITALLHQRKIWPIHASAIELEGNAIAFSGKSGSGKSTLAAYFQKKGYKVVSDDICAITINGNGIANITPAFPQIKLWENDLPGLSTSEKELKKVRNNLKKYGFKIDGQFYKDSLPLKRVYILDHKPKKFNISHVKATDKFFQLIECTHKPKALSGQGGREWLFNQCKKVVNTIEVRRLDHEYDSDFDALVDRIIEDFK